ncbi:MAG TPA: beta-ketoacyl synthase N-terminal-like domain-containing protein [Methylomusa anaerophila]|uniref:type I polyketide synthase n=1 Tax=Methylomusa anaerophila TaxID=1930071 RepID=UPI002BA2C65A|nr:beta-ketoacyl synthase N-terminal-like domain-containing protein [Methylomusa anaerophila]HML87606.1 beta-ketoacyl synthase N-terminal-like domain-containing protein [Methylomusa anaerophila]
MNNQLSKLYKQLQEGKISREAAVKQIIEFKLQHKSVSFSADNDLSTEIVKVPVTTLDKNKVIAEFDNDLLREKAIHFFKKLLSTVIKLPVQRIEADAPMEKYGIDSIMVMQMTNQLENTFGSLPKTLFFEYQSIQEIVGYFLDTYREKLVELLAAKNETETFSNNPPISPPAERPVSQGLRNRIAPAIAKSRGKTAQGPFDIAIIGVSGRYPGAKNIKEYWKNLQEGKDCISEIPKDRWDYSRYFDEDKNKSGTIYSKWGGFIEGVDQFDPLFFNISPREAEFIDPQERLFLQCVYETLEDAGYTRETVGMNREGGVDGNVGVYVGVMYEEYQLYGAQEQMMGRPIALTGSPASIANRVSYFCNFNGPSIAIDTMCSSSLTAIHLACQSLQSGGCQLAIAGGVNISVHPNKYLMLSQGKFLSSKGRCESFGQGGDGYVPGEGVGAVLLKPLDRAVADGDHIYGVIKGIAVNHGGKTNGYTVPNPNAQATVIGRALKQARINPRIISYIEAHGTGTFLGDPIEIAALSKTFQEYTADKQFCAIGSAKSNIGHCESAAGIAGVTKVLLQLKYHQLVPSLHSNVRNPNIDFGKTPFIVQQELGEWKRPKAALDGVMREYPRTAGISSFGAGGSNAHVVIEEYIPNSREVQIPSSPAIIVLSAKNEEGLKEQAKELLCAIEEQCFANTDLASMAYTLQVGREAMEERLAMTVGSVQELEEKLRDFVQGKDNIDDLYYGQVKRNKETLAVLATDEDMTKAIDAWFSKRKYAKLLELWVKGLNIDWNRLYPDTKPERISLPTYPFAVGHYWVPITKADYPNLAKENFVDDRLTVQKKICTLKKQWKQSIATPTKTMSRSIIILSTQETEGVAIELSKHFAESYVLNINDIEPKYSLPEDWQTYDGFVDLVGCGSESNESLVWIVLLQHLIELGQSRGLTLLCVTKGLESYNNITINLAGACRAGLYRMLQSEYSHLQSRHIDVEPCVADSTLAQQIATEFSIDSDDSEICYRDGTRFEAYLAETGEYVNRQSLVKFPEDHVLLVTGGTRGLGHLCARHFIKNYGVKRLVITGQEALPAREQWNFYKGLNNTLAKKIRAIEEIESQGIQVWALALTKENNSQQIVNEIRKSMGPIGGVIHCAGTGDFDNPAFVRKSIIGIEQVLNPKISVLNDLYQAVKNEPLQFFVMFSSVSAIIPALASGQSDYAMANAYMDYFAEANNSGCPIISIQWPSWKDTGMGEAKSKAYQQSGLLSITDTEGLDFLDSILAHKAGPVILPAVVNTDLWNPHQLMKRKIQKPITGATKSEKNNYVKSITTANNLIKATQEWLVALFSQELKIEPSQLDIDIPFQDFGVDSIFLVQLLRQINQLLLEEIDPSSFYEYSTIELLAGWLVENHASSLETLVAVDTQNSSADLSFSPSQKPAVVSLIKRLPQNWNSADIAVIGMSCRFPGANNLGKYWEMLLAGKTSIGVVPPKRWGKANNYYAGLLDNITDYDPDFFQIPKEDARVLDLQALLVLEESLKLWYHAGYTPKEIKGRQVGVYLGGRSRHQPEETILSRAHNPIMAIGQNYLAANISQFYDLHGPSVVVDTACSSALVAMNMGIQALHTGEIDSAVIGGVSLLSTDGAHRTFQQRGILANEPQFHIFDKRSHGVVLGEGVGLVLLKTVEQAIADGDYIYAVIKAVSINNDGRTAGPTSPNFQAQKEVMQAALSKSGKCAEEISYVEVNGSGSEVTDLLELKAIQSVYRLSNNASLGLGSIKPNIGHPLCAEGIASLIKVSMMLEQGQMAPFLSGEQPMTHYSLESSPFYFCRKQTAWLNKPRTAAINCFADGGTNAHVILEAWSDTEARKITRYPLIPPELNRSNVQSGIVYNSIWKQKLVEA